MNQAAAIIERYSKPEMMNCSDIPEPIFQVADEFRRKRAVIVEFLFFLGERLQHFIHSH